MKQVSAWIFNFHIFVCLVPVFRTLTPPRILYGGWTPIVPGHPFYFGPVTPPEQPKYQTHHHMHFGEPAIRHLPEQEHEVEHHVEYVSPQQFQPYNKPQEVYPSPPKHLENIAGKGHQEIPYGQPPHKDIFSYYPPQSAYDRPKEQEFDYKPVYFEIPKRPITFLNNAHIASLKGLPIDLKSSHPAYGRVSLKMKPVSDINLNVLKQIGHLNAGQLHHLVPQTKYPAIKDSSGGIPRKPVSLPYSYKNPESILAPYSANHLVNNAINVYKGNAGKQNKYLPLKRPLNPIETKYFRNPNVHVPKETPQINIPKLLNYKHLSIPVVSPNLYMTKSSMYSGPKYLPMIKPQALPSPVNVGKSIATAAKNYVFPSRPAYSVKPIVPIKPLYAIPRYSSNKSPPNLLTNYLHEDVKLHSLYKNPAVVTNIRGAPAIVEREVAIIHVPVRNSQPYPPDSPNNEYLYHTASTPESTQILDVSNLNESVPFTVLNKRIPVLNNNESYTHITLDFGKDVEHVTLVEPHVNSQIDPPVEKLNDARSPDQYEYIFVSSSGFHGMDQHNSVDHSQANEGLSNQLDAKKQYFHAYYGSSDHIPPPGYVKMTVAEFNNLFRNAEIRYVDKDLDTESSVKKEYHKSADTTTHE